jgi:hypothetical protein
MPQHKWSGWPGAYCLKCFAEDPYEIALADNTYDPFTGKWISEEAEAQANYDCWCPVEDEE